MNPHHHLQKIRAHPPHTFLCSRWILLLQYQIRIIFLKTGRYALYSLFSSCCVTIQHNHKLANKSLLLGVSEGNVGGMDADASLHGCIHGIFRKICPIAVTFSHVLNSYLAVLYEKNTRNLLMVNYRCNHKRNMSSSALLSRSRSTRWVRRFR